MEVTNLALTYLVREIQPLLNGARVKKVQEIDDNLFKFRLQSKTGSQDLIIAERALFITSFKIPAKKMTSGFGAFLNKHLKNKSILSMEQHNMDRIIVIDFGEVKMILEFLTEFNIILIKQDGLIISAWHKQQFRDRILAKGKEYQFPSTGGINPAEFLLQEGREILKEENKVVSVLVKGFNIPPFVGEAACDAIGCDKTQLAVLLSTTQQTRILQWVKTLYIEKEKGEETGFILSNSICFQYI